MALETQFEDPSRVQLALFQGQRWSATATRTTLASEGSSCSALPFACYSSSINTPALPPLSPTRARGCGTRLMSRQSNFDTATLTSAVDLAGPAPARQKAVKEQQNRACLGGMRRLDLSVRVHLSTRSLARGSGRRSKGSSTTSPDSLCGRRSSQRQTDLRPQRWSVGPLTPTVASTLGKVSLATARGGDPNVLETGGVAVGRSGCRIHSAVLAPGRDCWCLPTVSW